MPTSEQLDSSTKEIITRRKIRRRQVVAEVIKGELTYEQIGRKYYPNAKNGRQTVYSALQKPGAQAEIARIMNQSPLTPEYLTAKLTTAIESTQPKMNVHGKYLELGMRSQAMLTDRNINENINTNVDDLVQRASEAIKQLTHTLSAVGEGQGIETKDIKAE